MEQHELPVMTLHFYVGKSVRAASPMLLANAVRLLISEFRQYLRYTVFQQFYRLEPVIYDIHNHSANTSVKCI